VDVYRVYGGVYYSRTTYVFGEKEPITARALLKTPQDIPVSSAPINFFLDNAFVKQILTDSNGSAEYTFNGVPAGNHIITCVLAESTISASVNFTAVEMVWGAIRSYVDSVGNVTPAQVESSFMPQVLQQNIGFVCVDSKINTVNTGYVFTGWVPTQDTRFLSVRFGITTLDPILTALLILAVIAGIIAILTIIHQIIYEVLTSGWIKCGVCGQTFNTCDAYKAHMITAHPDVWAKMENDPDVCTTTPSGFGFDWRLLIYGGIAIAGIFLIAQIVGAFKK